MVFKRMVSIIYQKFYLSDRVPLNAYPEFDCSLIDPIYCMLSRMKSSHFGLIFHTFSGFLFAYCIMRNVPYFNVNMVGAVLSFYEGEI